MVTDFQIFKKIPIEYLKIIGCALALSIVAVLLSSQINSLAFGLQPIVGDGAQQYGYSAKSYMDYLYTGRLAAISDAYLQLPRPIWSIIPLIVNPNLLININGHIVVGGLFLFCFLSVMGISIFKRIRLVSYAFVCMVAVLAAANFFHYHLGMGGNYTDLQTAWLIGTALFSLINSEEGTRGHWLVSFGLFSALAQQSRFVSLGVIAIVCGPVLGYYLLKRWKSKRTARSILVPLSQALIFILVICSYSLIGKIDWYINANLLGPIVTSGVIHLYKPVSEAVATYLLVYDYHLGNSGIAILVAFCLTYFLLYWKQRGNIESLFISIWAAIAFLVTHIFVLRITGEWIYTVYLLPGFFLFSFIPFDLSHRRLPEISQKRNVHKVLSFGTLVILLIVSLINVDRISKNVVRVSPADSQIVSYQKDMAVILTGLAKRYYANMQAPTYESFVEIRDLPSAQPVYIEMWFRYHQPIRWVNLSLVWQSLYFRDYPNMSLEEVQAKVYETALADLDLVIVLSDPRNEKALRLSALFPELDPDEWNLKINEYMYKRLSEDPLHWSEEPIAEDGVYHSPFGDIHVYRNLKRYETRMSK